MTAPRRINSVQAQILKAAAAILVGELLIMLIVSALPGMPGLRVALVDTALLMIPVAIALYIFVYRARLGDMREREQTAEHAAQLELQNRELFGANPQSMWAFDTETLRFLAVNDAAVAHYGYGRAEFLAMTIADIRPPEDVPYLHETLRRQQENPGIEVAPARHLKKGGTRIDVEIRSHPIEFGGRSARLVLAFDVTERQRADLERQVLHEIAQSVATSANLDELLTLMHHSLQRVFEAENCFVALYDPQTELFSFPYFADQHDSTPLPVAMPRSCTAYVFRCGKPTLITPAVFRQLKEQHEVELVGSPSPSWMGVPLRTPSGMLGVLVLQHYDKENIYSEGDLAFLASVGSQVAVVIERKLAEVALRNSEAELNVILESTADGLLAVDKDGKVLRTNKRFAEMWRIPQSIIDSKDDDRLLQHVMGQLADPESFLAQVRALYNSVDESKDTVHFADGRVFERYSAAIIKNGNLAGRVWSFHDSTARTQAEQKNAALQAQLQQARKMESVGRLAGGVAHDFNNMLGVILGHAELALEQVDPDQPLHADLLEMRKAAVRSADLTRQLLAFARKQTAAPKVLDLNETVAGMLTMLQRLIGEDIDLNWKPKADLWRVRMDPSQIDQILANLCVNARDAIAGVGKITIETGHATFTDDDIAVHPEAVPGDYLLLAVSDDGSGMDAETLSQVFEPFFTTKAMGKGTGLGLATAYGIVKQNNGFIYAYSEPGLGTTFKIYLPRDVDSAAQVQTDGAAPPAPRGKETILLVEDEAAIVALTARILTRRGYTVLTAGSPGEAIRLASEDTREINLLITDVVMPGMNGLELSKSLSSGRPHLKCLFMSGYTAEVIASRGVLVEGVHFIQKPFSLEGMAAKVREALDSAG